MIMTWKWEEVHLWFCNWSLLRTLKHTWFFQKSQIPKSPQCPFHTCCKLFLSTLSSFWHENLSLTNGISEDNLLLIESKRFELSGVVIPQWLMSTRSKAHWQLLVAFSSSWYKTCWPKQGLLDKFNERSLIAKQGSLKNKTRIRNC